MAKLACKSVGGKDVGHKTGLFHCCDEIPSRRKKTKK